MKKFGKSEFVSSMFLLFIGLAGGFWPVAVEAATSSVSIQDNVFMPSSTTINVNDTVQWNWAAANINMHSSTGPGITPLWDSGIHGNGFTFSFTYTAAGSYAYHCSVHATQLGNITVQAPNQPPRVGITAPANNSTFSQPWTGTLQATNSDPDGTVVRVQFFSGTNSLGTVTNPPATATLRVTNIAAGTYTLTAKATDNLGAVTTSAGVTVHVVTPAPIVLSSPQRLLPSTFQFNYTTTTNLKYVVERSADLTAFTSLATNTASGSSASFSDTSAAGVQEYYRVKLQPNP